METRLQLRWEQGSKKGEWLCHYELILPLDEHDVRKEISNTDHLVIPIKEPTVRTSTSTPCFQKGIDGAFADTPYRDGAHAIWDSKKLGDLPIYVVTTFGESILWERTE